MARSLARRLIITVVVALLFASPLGLAQTKDDSLMSDADYKLFLAQVEAALPKWETQLKSIDPEKIPQISYSRAKSFLDNQRIGLTEISNIRLFVAEQRVKRTVYGELTLRGFLGSLFDAGEEIVWEESISGLTLTSLEKYAPELSAFQIRLENDAMARVALLEKGTCP